MRAPIPCRLSLVFASEAPVVVVLRRGPSRWVEVVEWNTARDSFRDGPWFHGRIYGERCGLSPDGKLFVYFAMNHSVADTAKGYEVTFTAVSKPPYLTALAMWPHGDTWGGGGRFVDNKTLRLASGAERTRHPHDAAHPPTEIYMAPMPEPHPDHPPQGLVIQTELDGYAPDRVFRAAVPIKRAEWSGRDHNDRPIVVRAGALFHVTKTGAEVLLRDFNGDARRRVVSPEWARSW